MKDNNYRNGIDKPLVIYSIAVAIVLIVIVAAAFLLASQDSVLNDNSKSEPSGTAATLDTTLPTTQESTEQSDDIQSTTAPPAAETTAPDKTSAAEEIKSPPAIGSELSVEYSKEFFADDLFFGESMVSVMPMYGIVEEKNIFASNNISHNNLLTKKADTPKGSLTIADYATQMSPQRIFIFVGTNSLSAKLGVEKMVKELEKLVDKLQKVSPYSKIYIIAHTPTTSKSDIDITAKQIKEYNEQAKVFAKVKGIGYIDAYNLLVNGSDSLRDEFVSSNGIFLNAKGYKALLSYIQTALS